MVHAGTSPGALGSLLELVVNFQRAVAQKLSQHSKQQEVKQEKQALCWICELFQLFNTGRAK